MNNDSINKEKFKETFSEIHASEQLRMRVMEISRDINMETKKKFHMPKIAVAVLILVCFISGTSAIAVENGFSFMKLFKSKTTPEESTYSVPVRIKKVPTDYFSGKMIKEVKKIVLEQVAAYEPWMSSLPECYSKTFHSVEDAMKYMGIADIEHPLIGEGKDVTLDILCDDKGEVRIASLQTSYDNVDGNRVEIWYTIYTNLTDRQEITGSIGQSVADGGLFDTGVYDISSSNASDSSDKDYVIIDVECAAPEYVEYMVEAGRLGSGMEVPVITSSTLESGVNIMDSFFAKGAVLYNIRLISDTGDSEKLKGTLDNILKLY